MFVWPDGTVTGSVNVEELAVIREALESGGMKHPDDNPIEHVDQLVKGKSKAKFVDTVVVPAVAAPTADDATAEAASKVDLPELLDKATGKGKS